jgi:predicted  nucleic acid-binding Zn-ribbon protein
MPLHAQDIDEDILLQRFRQNKKLDSLQNIEQKSAADKDEIVTLKETLLDIDNRLLRNYINEGTIDSRRSRLRMLLNENNRLKAQQDSLRSLTRTMYIVIAVFILALLTMGYFLYHTWHKWRTEQQARQEIQKTYEADQSRYHQIEDNENELVDELKSELGSYKEELSKASRFLVNLRNEKIKLENELEELKEVHNKLKKDHRQVATKLDKLQNKGDEAFEKLKNEKEEAEDKFNDLYKRYQ